MSRTPFTGLGGAPEDTGQELQVDLPRLARPRSDTHNAGRRPGSGSEADDVAPLSAVRPERG
ncbi:hypothetical protein [Nonomuraea sp. JJY05]|uniref:hypothetical protein n=1 Tax=Nonomuraea sp. JJY05 TaxID=3350255 RepID=UPI00373E95D3